MVLCGSFPNEASPKTTATKKNMRSTCSDKTRLATGGSIYLLDAGTLSNFRPTNC